MSNLILRNKIDLNKNLFWGFCVLDLLCIFAIIFFKSFFLSILILMSLAFVFSLCSKSAIKFGPFWMLLIIYTAPLERIRWDIGFALRPIIIISLIGFYLLTIKFLLREFKVDIKAKRLFILCFLLISVFLLSSITSLDLIKSIRVTILYLTLFILLFLTIELVENKTQFILYLKHYMIIGLILSLYGVLQLLGLFLGFNPDVLFLSRFTWTNSQIGSYSLFNFIGFRINSLFTDCNNFAGYLNTVFPLFFAGTLYFSKIKDNRKLFVYGIGALIVGSVLVLTFSRSGWMGLLAGLVVLLIDKRKELLKSGVVGYLLLFLMILALLIVPFKSYLFPSIEYRLTEKASSNVHFFVMKSAFSMFLSNPLTGVGIGNFGEAYGKYFKPGFEYYNPHSAYLAILSETGLLGFLLYMAIYYYILKQILFFKRKTEGFESQVIGSGLLAGFVGLLIANIFYQNYTFQFFFVFLGLAFAAGLIADKINGSKDGIIDNNS
jgi:O-antigen ligase